MNGFKCHNFAETHMSLSLAGTALLRALLVIAAIHQESLVHKTPLKDILHNDIASTRELHACKIKAPGGWLHACSS